MDIERKLLNLAQRRSDVSLTQDISLEDYNKSIVLPKVNLDFFVKANKVV